MVWCGTAKREQSWHSRKFNTGNGEDDIALYKHWGSTCSFNTTTCWLYDFTLVATITLSNNLYKTNFGDKKWSKVIARNYSTSFWWYKFQVSEWEKGRKLEG